MLGALTASTVVMCLVLKSVKDVLGWHRTWPIRACLLGVEGVLCWADLGLFSGCVYACVPTSSASEVVVSVTQRVLGGWGTVGHG